MASAMIGGLLAQKFVDARQIVCTSAPDGTGEQAAKRFGIRYTPDFAEVVTGADIVVLAIKPQQIDQLPDSIGAQTADKLILSILAGITLERLNRHFSQARNLIRAMPNTPGQIGYGVSAYASLKPLSHEDQQRAEGILGSLGALFAVPESQLDAVTGVSGSGPAYLFEFVAALRDGGIAAGLAPELAYQLALETARGASELLKQVPESPEQHRDWVSSPGGTTLAGLELMQERRFREILRDTVLAAAERSRQLARGQ